MSSIHYDPRGEGGGRGAKKDEWHKLLWGHNKITIIIVKEIR